MIETSSLQGNIFPKHSPHKIATLLLQQGEAVQISLTGHCMKPLLRENDLITIQPFHAEQLRCGDVAIYLINGKLKAHRFLKRIIIDEHHYLITKSDRRFRCDNPVPYKDLLGKIIQVKKGTKLVDYKSRQWEIINYLLGKLSPYISFIEYFYKRSRGFIVRFIKLSVGNRKTARIIK
jgi:hypothetical protein